jgi:hypothetical protein
MDAGIDENAHEAPQERQDREKRRPGDYETRETGSAVSDG